MVKVNSRVRCGLATVVLAGAALGCGEPDDAASQATTETTSAPRSAQVTARVAGPQSTQTTTITAPAPQQRSAVPLRFASTPVVLFAERQPGTYLISIVFKMRQPLPENGPRDVSATVLVGDVRPMLALARFSPRPCYEQRFDEAPPGSQLERPRDGQSVTVSVSIKGQPRRSVAIEAVMRKAAPRRVTEPTAADVARIGCKGERPR